MMLSACQRFDSSVPNGWALEPIGKRIALEYGTGLTDTERTPGAFQVFGSNGPVGTHDKYLVEGPGILVGRKGSVGEVHFSEGNFWPIDTVYYVAQKANDDLRFVACLLEFLRLDTLNAATGVPGLTRRDALFMLGAFPPPAEQTRIAETLKAADDHIRALEEHARKAERVFRALLSDLFNGLSAAPKVKGRQCFTLHGYVNFDDGVAFTPEGQTAYFKVDDFNSPGNERQLVRAAARIAIDPGSKSVPFEVGNVIFAKRGAALTKNRVRINAVPCFLDPNLMLMRPIPDVVEAAFLRYYLMRFRLEKLGEDAGIPQLNNKDLYPKEFPIPGQTVRDSICQALFAAEDLVDSVNAQLTAARRVKQSLLQNLLTGKIRLKP